MTSEAASTLSKAPCFSAPSLGHTSSGGRLLGLSQTAQRIDLLFSGLGLEALAVGAGLKDSATGELKRPVSIVFRLFSRRKLLAGSNHGGVPKIER